MCNATWKQLAHYTIYNIHYTMHNFFAQITGSIPLTKSRPILFYKILAFSNQMCTKIVWHRILGPCFCLFVCLFFFGCADLMLVSNNHFYQELRDLTPFTLFLLKSIYIEPPWAKSLQNGVLVFLLSQQKLKLVTTHKMASHLMHNECNLSGKHVFDWC